MVRMTSWEHDLSEPLPELPSTPQDNEQIQGASASCLRLWRSLFPLARTLGGYTDVTVLPDSDFPIAVSILLPPGVRPGYISLLTSGWISSFVKLGPKSAYRFRQGHVLAEKLWPPVLQPLNEKYETGAYVLVLGTNPEHAGHGYAGKLLQWQIEKYRPAFPRAPIYLETATDPAQRVYERLGFKEMKREQMKLPGVDERGCKATKVPGQDDREMEWYFALRCMRLGS